MQSLWCIGVGFVVSFNPSLVETLRFCIYCLCWLKWLLWPYALG